MTETIPVRPARCDVTSTLTDVAEVARFADTYLPFANDGVIRTSRLPLYNDARQSLYH